MQRIATDVLKPLNVTQQRNRFLIVVTDYFTKWEEIAAAPNQEAETVTNMVIDTVFSWCTVRNSF